MPFLWVVGVLLGIVGSVGLALEADPLFLVRVWNGMYGPLVRFWMFCGAGMPSGGQPH